MQTERPLWNPYLTGVALGLVLLASFLVLGFGLGSSGAANRVAITAAHAVAPETVEANAYMGKYVAEQKHLLDDWLVFMVLGVFLGGAVGAFSGGRMRSMVVQGPNISRRNRIILAVLGGVITGVGARLARGCASGQALTGGSLLSASSWTFMMMFFAGAYIFAFLPFIRRQWR